MSHELWLQGALVLPDRIVEFGLLQVAPDGQIAGIWDLTREAAPSQPPMRAMAPPASWQPPSPQPRRQLSKPSGRRKRRPAGVHALWVSTLRVPSSTSAGRALRTPATFACPPARRLIAGSSPPALPTTAVRNMVRLVGLDLPTAVAMASLHPARRHGLAERLGSLAVGKVADVVVLDKDLQATVTLVGGQVAFDGR